jgi:hypothetical protein
MIKLSLMPGRPALVASNRTRKTGAMEEYKGACFDEVSPHGRPDETNMTTSD